MICPVDCIMITGTKLPKGEQLWDSMNVVHLKDGREIIGIIEGDDKKIKSEDSITLTNITSRQGSQEVIDRLEPSGVERRTQTFSSDEVSRVVTRNPVVSTSISSILICLSVCIVDFALRFVRQSVSP